MPNVKQQLSECVLNLSYVLREANLLAQETEGASSVDSPTSSRDDRELQSWHRRIWTVGSALRDFLFRYPLSCSDRVQEQLRLLSAVTGHVFPAPGWRSIGPEWLLGQINTINTLANEFEKCVAAPKKLRRELPVSLQQVLRELAELQQRQRMARSSFEQHRSWSRPPRISDPQQVTFYHERHYDPFPCGFFDAVEASTLDEKATVATLPSVSPRSKREAATAERRQRILPLLEQNLKPREIAAMLGIKNMELVRQDVHRLRKLRKNVTRAPANPCHGAFTT